VIDDLTGDNSANEVPANRRDVPMQACPGERTPKPHPPSVIELISDADDSSAQVLPLDDNPLPYSTVSVMDIGYPQSKICDEDMAQENSKPRNSDMLVLNSVSEEQEQMQVQEQVQAKKMPSKQMQAQQMQAYARVLNHEQVSSHLKLIDAKPMIHKIPRRGCDNVIAGCPGSYPYREEPDVDALKKKMGKVGWKQLTDQNTFSLLDGVKKKSRAH